MDKKTLKEIDCQESLYSDIHKKTVYKTKIVDGKVLAVFFYRPMKFCTKTYELFLKHFVCNDDFLTLKKINDKQRIDNGKWKWFDGKIDNYVQIYNSFNIINNEKYSWFDTVPYDIEDDKRIALFLNKVEKEYENLYNENRWLIEVYKKEENILYKKNENKLENELKKFDYLNNDIGKLPKSVENWATREIVEQNLIYCRKDKIGVCTFCGNKNSIKLGIIRRGSKIRCKNCGTVLVAKPNGNFKTESVKVFSFAQKCNFGMVVRYFKIAKSINRNTDIDNLKKCCINEIYRDFIDSDGNVIKLMFGAYKGKVFGWYEDKGHFSTYWKVDNDYRYDVDGFYFDSYKFLNGCKGKYKITFGKARSKRFKEILCRCPTDYFMYSIKYPLIEMLAKSMNYTLIECLMKDNSIVKAKMLEPCLFRALGIPKEKEYMFLDSYKSMTGDLKKDTNILETQYELWKEKNVLDDEVTEFISNMNPSYDALCEILGNGKIRKTIRYFNRQHQYNNDLSLIEYKDYISMCKERGMQLTRSVLFPQNLRKAHDEMMTYIGFDETDENEIKYQKLLKKELSQFKEYETNELIIRLPISLREVIFEGKYQSHCVGRYVNQLANNETVILFIREKKSPSIPYYTLEVKNFKIVQCRTKYNKSAPTELVNIVGEYLQYIKQKPKRKIRKVG